MTRGFLQMLSSAGLLLLAGCLLLATVAIAAIADPVMPPATAPAMVRIPGEVLPALAKAKRVGSVGLAEEYRPITLTIVLKHDDQAGFERYLQQLRDPHSPNFRRYLNQRQIADRFGPSVSHYRGVMRYLAENGFNLVEGSTNRLTLTMRGTRAQAERALDTEIDDYAIGKRRFYANDRDPALPRSIAASVQAIQGLSNLARLYPVVQIIKPFPSPQPSGTQTGPTPTPKPKDCTFESFEGCFQSNKPSCIGQVGSNLSACYCQQAQTDQKCLQQCSNANSLTDSLGNSLQAGVNKETADNCGSFSPGALHSNNARVAPQVASVAPPKVTGAGQTVGLVEFDSFSSQDISNYLSLMGLPSTLINNVTKVDVDGGVAPGANQDEVLVDIAAILNVAPGAQIRVYDAPFNGTGSFQAVFNKMITDGVTVISNSWAYCEDQTTRADVQSIDAIFQNAAMQGISVFNGSGDRGSTCLDGSADTIGVPADSPNATAVGGTTLTRGPGDTYGSEAWWNGSANTPPTGAGGFGVSKFFAAPSYQTGLNGSGMRSIPDVTAPADPEQGVVICEASNGGCPNGYLYGGTSNTAPMWAAIAAILNEAVGHNLGALNPLIYPLAGTDVFHGPASMVPPSDFAHVGLGSPNIDALYLKLSGTTVGTPSATVSQVDPRPSGAAVPAYVPADGSSPIAITVTLRDASGNVVSGKTVTLAAGAGSSAKIAPASVVTRFDGTAVFTVTDLVAETVTLTAHDTSDGLTLTPALTPTVVFVSPPATAAAIGALPATVTADGKAATTITITLQDALGRPASGKIIQLTQGSGESVIAGPNPPVTDSGGEIQFTATDTNNETVTYTAVDVSDGNLPFPQTTQVTFNSAVASGCASGTPQAAPGYVITPVATGFEAQDVSQGAISFSGCPGASAPAFDSAGNMYVSDFVDGNLYKFPSTGGVAGATTKLAAIGETLAQPVFSGSSLWVVRAATTGGAAPSTFFEVDPATGSVLNSFTGVFCSSTLAADPLSGGLFSSSLCGTTAHLWHSTLAGSPPSFSVYADMPAVSPGSVAFLPGGTIYVEGGTGTSNPYVAEVSPTNVSPTTVTQLAGLTPSDLGLVVLGSGNTAQSLIVNLPEGSAGASETTMVDLTTNPPTIASPLTVNSILGGGFGGGLTLGPDGCLYGGRGNAVYKLSRSDGSCPFTSATQPLSLALNPPITSAAQGSKQTFTATFHYGAVPDGTVVTLGVGGANPQTIQATTKSNTATFSYTASNQGVDTLGAFSNTGSGVASNHAVVTWTAGTDVTFLTLNQSPGGATSGQQVTLSANLTDGSVHPIAPLSGQTVNFSVGAANCSGVTDANGNATCQVTPSGAGVITLTANFAGTSQFNTSSASKQFAVLAVPVAPTPTATPTSTPTATVVPTPISPGVVTATAVNSHGSPNQTVGAGSFTVDNTSASAETINSVAVSFSDPGLFSSATLSATINASREQAPAATPPSASTTFTFSPALTLPAGATASFALEATVAMNPTMRAHRRMIAYADSNAGMGGFGGGSAALLGGLLLLGLMLCTFIDRGARRRVALIALLTIALAAGASACGGNHGGTPPSTPTSTQQVTAISGPAGALNYSGLPANLGTIAEQ